MSHLLNIIKMQVFLFIAFLLALCQTQPDDNFQRRIIYFSEEDNVCYYGADSDVLDISVEIDGVNAKRVYALSGTFCREWVQRYRSQIKPVSVWDYVDSDSKMIFDDEIFYYPVLEYISATSRIRSPALINGKMRNCAIENN